MNLRRKIPYLLLLLLAPFAFLPSGCATLGYYAQSISGQMDLWAKQQDIQAILHDDRTRPDLKDKLSLVLRIRDFASDELGLPDNDSYRSYADIERPYVVWNVFAAPEFSLELHNWCFPVAGCVGYRGYFSKADAEAFAGHMRAEGYDVYVAPISAYSTLGWFDDPLLNTVLRRDEAHLAGLIFHELAHQELYVKNDTPFNEGFAKTVELEGVKRWMEANGTPRIIKVYEDSRRQRNDFVKLVAHAQEELNTIYQTDAPAMIKRMKKKEVFETIRAAYRDLKANSDGHSRYDHWFSKELNNAKFASVLTYTDYVPAFQALLESCENDFSCFYDEAREIGALPANERQARLHELGLIKATSQQAMLSR